MLGAPPDVSSDAIPAQATMTIVAMNGIRTAIEVSEGPRSAVAAGFAFGRERHAT